MTLLTMALSQGPDKLLQQDDQARIDALDTTRSFLVQAPAGSGKTELLTQRLLALLGVVERPEQVLAITFTVAATAEMRRRVVDALEEAQASLDRNSDEPHETQQLAIAALKHARHMGWNLLEQPQRLNIQTLDSLCLRIAHEAPLLSRLGGQLQPTEDVEPLYALAARRTMEQLGGAHTELSRALEQLLRLRGVSLSECEKLIAEMLGKRDRWLEEFSAAHSLSENEWADLRGRREEPLRREHERVCGKLRELITSEPELFKRVLELAAYACGNDPAEAIHELANVQSVDELQELVHFNCLRSFLLTRDDTWRKAIDKKLGFPPADKGGSAEKKQAFAELLLQLSGVPRLREALVHLKTLPNLTFTDDEWQTIRSIFTVLLHAAAELRVVFAERSVIDFVEAGITAEHALRNNETRRRWSDKIHHLLVDEFQDTSRRQYTLLKDIVRDWDMTENRTCFLVGDPMQSIYLFRNAELALFDEVHDSGFGRDVEGLHFTHLTLARNFRSTAGIVEPVNEMFAREMGSGAAGAVRFTPALANAESPAMRSLHLHVEFEIDRSLSNQGEAQRAVALISRHLPALELARKDNKDFRIGVLVRTKKQVALIAAALREADIPYRAVDIETLDRRQEVQDLLSLMRALLSPVDRIAWLALLRAPWCGLSLADLHLLSGGDDRTLQKLPMRELLAQRSGLLSEDGQLRARRVQETIELALAQRFAGTFIASPQGFASWIEQTWLALGGRHCIDAGQTENVDAFFRLLATLKPSGLEASDSLFTQRLAKLFAQPDPRAPENCSVQLMTIHKAKGLGFDVVLVPRLHERSGGSDDAPLLRWMVRNQHGSDQRELLIAPIGAKGASASPTYDWIAQLQKREEHEEMHRLLYVACTRARTELHLFANLGLKHSKAGVEVANPSDRSLLGCGWAYLSQFAQQQLMQHLLLTVPSIGMQVAPAPGILFDMAAGSADYRQQIKRLPATWAAASGEPAIELRAELSSELAIRPRMGSFASRARGTVLHALFESLAALPVQDARRNVSQGLTHWKAVAAAMLHHAGLHRRELEAELKTILSLLQTAATDPDAQWIMGRRVYARSESSWTTREEGALKIMRCDRVFIAGAEPRSEGEDHLWIVDYKTAEGDNAFLLEERKRHEPQLQRYAAALREATQSTLPLRLALYYPALPHLLWWEA